MDDALLRQKEHCRIIQRNGRGYAASFFIFLLVRDRKLGPIRKGGAILRERVGTLKIQADDLAGSLGRSVKS